MEKEFDFKNIGKQMPYRTPDGFFDRMHPGKIVLPISRNTYLLKILEM